MEVRVGDAMFMLLPRPGANAAGLGWGWQWRARSRESGYCRAYQVVAPLFSGLDGSHPRPPAIRSTLRLM
eukprot:15433165-Alexandrium_andersonii.AAC.1